MLECTCTYTRWITIYSQSFRPYSKIKNNPQCTIFGQLVCIRLCISKNKPANAPSPHLYSINNSGIHMESFNASSFKWIAQTIGPYSTQFVFWTMHLTYLHTYVRTYVRTYVHTENCVFLVLGSIENLPFHSFMASSETTSWFIQLDGPCPSYGFFFFFFFFIFYPLNH